MRKRIVITGMGIISSIGNGSAEVVESLKSNKSGIVAVPEWEKYGLKSPIAGTIKGLDIDKVREDIGLKSRYMSIAALYSALSAKEAVIQSGLTEAEITSEKMACIIGTSYSDTESIYQAANKIYNGAGRITPYDLNRGMSSNCSANMVYLLGIKGRSYSISAACATSAHNIGNAYELIKAGKADMALTGGAEEISPVFIAMFDGMRNLLASGFNDRPEKASRAYDRDRNGFVMSGGAGVLILEELEHALKRNANILCEIVGYGASSDGYDMIHPPQDGEGAYRCMKEALTESGCNPKDIEYINTHGTSTVAGDLSEVKAIDRLLGKNVMFSSTKSLTGHGTGAAGAHELIYCILMLQNNFITASVNIENLDPAFDGFNIVTKNIYDKTISTIMTNSFGFGGTNSCLIIKKFKA